MRLWCGTVGDGYSAITVRTGFKFIMKKDYGADLRLRDGGVRLRCGTGRSERMEGKDVCLDKRCLSGFIASIRFEGEEFGWVLRKALKNGVGMFYATIRVGQRRPIALSECYGKI